MKASQLKLEEIVQFAEGRIDLHGRRLVLHSIHAFAQLRKDMVESLGLERTKKMFTRFGYYWGQADAAAMARIFQWKDTAEWIRAGPRMHSLQGVAHAVIKSLDMDAEQGRLCMEVFWRSSGEADEHLLTLGRSDVPICWMLTGYASGYASFCLGKDVYFVEQTCQGRGDKICSAIGKDRDSWGPEVQPFLSSFQEQDSIHNEILGLTKELKSKTRELERQRRKVKQLQNPHHASFAEVHSKSFQSVLELANRVAKFDSSLLITGESGSGKEILARHIHRQSARAQGDFVAINCGSLPETLLEAELFGHKAGAFTGATGDRIGLFEQANKGTLFLDEIGDISPAMQVRLLRVLQENEVLRVGENIPRKINVRIIAATHFDLIQRMQEAKFREDLYYRLSVIEIHLPPLRERVDDILPLARYFLGKLSQKLNLPKLTLQGNCLDYLLRYRWPGNVRELENVLERAAVLSQEGLIRPEHLPMTVIHANPLSEPGRGDVARSLADMEKEHIATILQLTDNNRVRAAEILGISYTTLWRKMKSSKLGD
ncbi:MAG: sigma 54-interacting transcriptional regulator [Phycisphaerae bacterium]|nr:sigma 54-interacting transcriptional regulator [Phycisphaerae bacterium]